MSFQSFFNKRAVVLKESDMLDISILNIDKAKSKLASLLGVPVVITEKTDGTKLTIVRNDAPCSKDWKANWIVAYKGNIIYPEDYEGISPEVEKEVRSKSIGMSQYKFVFDVLRKAHPNTKSIPPNTELFLEFIMRKPTLTREYTNYHNMVLIAVSSTKYSEYNGRLKTTPGEFTIKGRDAVAKMLGIPIPKVLFRGTLNELVHSEEPNEMVKELKDHFLLIPSEYGGAMEGVVFEFDDGTFLKILQDDQHDKAVRQGIKAKHAPANSEAYYAKIKQIARMIVDKIGNVSDLKQALSQASKWIYGPSYDKELTDLDPNKTLINAKDDAFLTTKTLLIRSLPGNNNALFLGRFSPLTIAHYNIIANALKQFDGVVINLVKAKVDERNPFPVDLQIKMLQACFGDSIDIMTSSTGNIVTILNKSDKVISTVLAGTDRVQNYRDQLVKSEEIKVQEIPRVDEVSGTKVRNAIKNGDIETFQINTPKQVWPFFNELKKYIK